MKSLTSRLAAGIAGVLLTVFAPAAYAQTISQPVEGSTIVANNSLGQSFTATLTGFVTAIDVRSLDTTTATLYLYNGSAASGVLGSVGTPAYTQTGVAVTAVPTGGAWSHIVLSTPFPVVAGNTYTFTLTNPGLWGSTSDPYAGGTMVSDYATIWNSIPFSIDLGFQIYEITELADLSITMTDGVTTATAGGSTTYTITASNAGPYGVVGALVSDTFPASLTPNWTCVGAGGGTCTAAGTGNINNFVNLPAGGSVTYTVSAAISAAATGTLSNTATITAPVAAHETSLGNNSATDTDAIVRSANLAITKTDGVTVANPGGSVTYTITASNAGPSNAPGATVADTFPASLTGTWTCVGAGGGTCTAAGAGNITNVVNLPAGGSVTYTVTATINALATGTLSNTATVTAPVGVTDPVPGNNSATDTDTLVPQADLAITKTDGVTTATPGGLVTYTITASNAGPSNATGATVADTFPASLTGTWTCVGAGGGTCTAAGAGNINDNVNLPAGGSVTYTVTATINPAATGTLVNTATVAAPGGVTDSNAANNSATDTDALTLITYSGSSATGTGTITAGFTPNGACTFSAPQFIGVPPGAPPIPPTAPSGVDFKHGLFDFSVTGCTNGATVNFTIVYPQPLAGNTRYFKYGPTLADPTPHWYILPATIVGNTVTFSITDGGLGDDDLVANGTIVDQGGPGISGPPGHIPTLNQWMLLLLALLMGGMAARTFRRRGDD